MFRKLFHFVFLLLFSALPGFSQSATDTNLSAAQIEGRALTQETLALRPETNTTLTGVLKIRHNDGEREGFPVKFQTIITATNWQAIYETAGEDYRVKYLIIHTGWQNRFFEIRGDGKIERESSSPFANSDFWLCDLGLEFFHWPEQKVLKHEMKSGRSCKVLESTNPSPATNGYSRVVSWIDNESLGIVQAEAYDSKNALLKEFEPRNFKKVNGQWQLQEMQMRNVQTGSRTRIEFDLNNK